MDSLGPKFDQVSKFLTMMQLPDYIAEDDTGKEYISIEHACVPEYNIMLDRLEQGALVPIGLVYVAAHKDALGQPVKAVSRRGALWDNHQVLAYGFTRVLNGDHSFCDVKIYDPNFPGNDNVILRITLHPAEPDGAHQKANATQPFTPSRVTPLQRIKKNHSRPVRGFFVMPYNPAEPPGTHSSPF
jgi:hypothetical protein